MRFKIKNAELNQVSGLTSPALMTVTVRVGNTTYEAETNWKVKGNAVRIRHYWK